MATKLQTKIYTKEGKEAGNITLPESVFNASWNATLVHEVVRIMQSNARSGTAHTKDRGEVRGGGRKPWRQKGTGRARHGSRRSPIWTGGGVTFGPRKEKVYAKKVNKKIKAKALACVLSKKFQDGEILFLEKMVFDTPKTKEAKATLNALAKIKGNESLSTKKRNMALLALANRDENTEKSFRNFSNIRISQVKNINPVELLTYKYVVITEPKEAIGILKNRTNIKKDTPSASAKTKVMKKK